MQINPKLDCTLYSGFIVYFVRNTQLRDHYQDLNNGVKKKRILFMQL